MKREISTWLAGLLGALAWLPATGNFLVWPERATAPAWTIGLGALATAALALLAGRAASRDAEAPRAAGALAGAQVGGLAWLFGVAPFLSIWTQLPALHPLNIAPDANSLVATAMADCLQRAMLSFSTGAALALLGGAALGGAARGGVRGGGFPTPNRHTTAAALITLVMGGFIALAYAKATAPLAVSLSSVRAGGMMLLRLHDVDVTWRVATASLGLITAASAAIGVAGLRDRPRPWYRILALPALIALLGLFDPQLYGWSALVIAGALAGAGVPLRPAVDAPAGGSTWLLVPMAMAMGLSTYTMGLALSLGMVSRIGVLSQQGAAAAPEPELLGQLAGAAAACSVGGLLLAAPVLYLGVRPVLWCLELGRARQAFREMLELSGAIERQGGSVMNNNEGVSRRWVGVLVLAGLASAAAVGALSYSAGKSSGIALEQKSDPDLDVTEVVIATRELPVGRPISERDVELRAMPSIALPLDVVVRDPAELIGRSPAERILPNEVIRYERMGVQPPQGPQP